LKVQEDLFLWPLLNPNIRYMSQPMMGMMTIMCQISLSFEDLKSLRIMSIKASMVRPREMPKIIRI